MSSDETVHDPKTHSEYLQARTCFWRNEEVDAEFRDIDRSRRLSKSRRGAKPLPRARADRELAKKQDFMEIDYPHSERIVSGRKSPVRIRIISERKAPVGLPKNLYARSFLAEKTKHYVKNTLCPTNSISFR